LQVPNPGRIGGEFPRISAPHDFQVRRTRAVSPHTWISARGAYLLGGKAEYTRVRTCFEYTMRLECAAITNDKRVCARFCVPNTTWKLTTNELGRGRSVEATATSRYIAWTRRHGRGRGGLRRESAAIRSIMRIRVLSAAATSSVPLHVLLVVIHRAAMPVTVILARMRGLF